MRSVDRSAETPYLAPDEKSRRWGRSTLEGVRTASLVVIALTLVVIAIQLSRSASYDSQRKCLDRADAIGRTESPEGGRPEVLAEYVVEYRRCVGLEPLE